LINIINKTKISLLEENKWIINKLENIIEMNVMSDDPNFEVCERCEVEIELLSEEIG
jgi:uncharacterized protein with PIN domain